MYSYLCDAEDMLADFRTGELEKNIVVARKVLKKVLIASSAGNDMSYAFSHLSKLLASTDFFTKKLANWYLASNIPSDSELVILIINTLMKDSQSANPLIRGLAIRSLGLTSLPSLAEHKVLAFRTALVDSDPYVRRAAVLSCIKLCRNTDIDHRAELVNHLYSLIRDKDPVVIISCLIALERILSLEGGVVINRSISRHLLHQLDDFPEPQVSAAFSFLMKCKPRNEQDALEAMNLVDPILKTSNGAVIIQFIEYLLFLVKEGGMSHLREQVMLRVSSHLIYVVSSDVPEMSYAALDFISVHLIPEFLGILQSYRIQSWYCRHSDPLYLKLAKIQLLPELTNDLNLDSTLQELTLYSRDGSCKVAVCAIEALGSLTKKHRTQESKIWRVLLSVFGLTSDERILTATCSVLVQAKFKFTSQHTQMITTLINSPALAALSPEGKTALLPIIAQWADLTDDALYFVENMLEDINASSSPLLLGALLSTLFRIFLKKPAQSQELLGQVLELSSISDDVDLRDKAMLYYRLLHTENIADYLVLTES